MYVDSPKITGEAQVWYSDMTVLVQEDVGGLQVSVDNVASVMFAIIM